MIIIITSRTNFSEVVDNHNDNAWPLGKILTLFLTLLVFKMTFSNVLSPNNVSSRYNLTSSGNMA